MASCMECVHFNPCNSHGKIIVEKPTEGNDWGLQNNVENECKYFTPTADVEEVTHGHYKYDEKDDKWRCSECSAERPRNNGEIPYSDIYCCYKCGAIMDGRSDT